MYGASQNSPYQDPERTWQETELGRKHCTRKRAGPGDGSEMMAEKDITVCFVIIQVVSHAVRWHTPRRIGPQDPRCYEQAVEPVCYGKDTQSCKHKYGRIEP